MSCGFDREMLSLYADGMLERERLLQVEDHLSGCVECQGVFAGIRAIGKALGSLPRESASRSLIERIIAETEGKTRYATWDVLKRTVGTVWAVMMDGFRIEDDQEEALRIELPTWVARWVLFV